MNDSIKTENKSSHEVLITTINSSDLYFIRIGDSINSNQFPLNKFTKFSAHNKPLAATDKQSKSTPEKGMISSN